MEKLIFLGDSITDAHRLWLPEYGGLGDGYVKLLNERLTALDITVLNKGHDGFTLPFLLQTLDRDCLRQRPDGVSVLIGINDVGVSRNTGKSLGDQEFGSNYDLLIRRLLDGGVKQIFLLGPFLFAKPQEFLTWMAEVREAESIAWATARRYCLPFLPLLERMTRAADAYGVDAVTTDGIHLTSLGHRLLSDWWWEAFGPKILDPISIDTESKSKPQATEQ